MFTDQNIPVDHVEPSWCNIAGLISIVTAGGKMSVRRPTEAGASAAICLGVPQRGGRCGYRPIGSRLGGTVLLEIARSGADVAGVVSCRGGLATPIPPTCHRLSKFVPFPVYILSLLATTNFPGAKLPNCRLGIQTAVMAWEMR